MSGITTNGIMQLRVTRDAKVKDLIGYDMIRLSMTDTIASLWVTFCFNARVKQKYGGIVFEKKPYKIVLHEEVEPTELANYPRSTVRKIMEEYADRTTIDETPYFWMINDHRRTYRVPVSSIMAMDNDDINTMIKLMTPTPNELISFIGENRNQDRRPAPVEASMSH
jgi:hypothetical protein